MARPVKLRTICEKPRINIFGPKSFKEENCIEMSLEEYESIRLIDYNNLTQEECANFMGVARTTVQKIYDNARGKIADVLVNGKTLIIKGGNYQICNNKGYGKYCNRKHCRKFES
ncbi:MAG: DUF134 domain-containing protein [Bacilli bacterium]|nr:DUF134 domain-containing protein [Bacilli bacterium]